MAHNRGTAVAQQWRGSGTAAARPCTAAARQRHGHVRQQHGSSTAVAGHSLRSEGSSKQRRWSSSMARECCSIESRRLPMATEWQSHRNPSAFRRPSPFGAYFLGGGSGARWGGSARIGAPYRCSRDAVGLPPRASSQLGAIRGGWSPAELADGLLQRLGRLVASFERGEHGVPSRGRQSEELVAPLRVLHQLLLGPPPVSQPPLKLNDAPFEASVLREEGRRAQLCTRESRRHEGVGGGGALRAAAAPLAAATSRSSQQHVGRSSQQRQRDAHQRLRIDAPAAAAKLIDVDIDGAQQLLVQ